jgi:parallel beta-helix repeat protein
VTKSMNECEFRTRLVCILLMAVLTLTSSISIIPLERDNHLGQARVEFRPAAGYEDHEPIWVQSNADLLNLAASEGWPGNGNAGSPIIISGYRFSAIAIQPVRIWNTDLHWLFMDNYITTEGVVCGIWVDTTTAGAILNNTFEECHSAIVMLNTENLIIENNTFAGNVQHGIEMDATNEASAIRNNEFSNNGGSGILCNDASNLEISGNYIDGVTFTGINIKRGTDNVIENNIVLNSRSGISLERATNNTHVLDNVIRGTIQDAVSCTGDFILIQHNVIRDIGTIGVSLSELSGAFADSSTISGNTFINCTSYAVRILEGCTKISITENDFFDGGNAHHILDNSSDAVIEGNFYDTWSSPDVNHDGIVDTPFEISGAAQNNDPSPKSAPNNEIPEDYEYVPKTTTSTGTEEPDLAPVMLVAGIAVAACVVLFAYAKRR